MSKRTDLSAAMQRVSTPRAEVAPRGDTAAASDKKKVTIYLDPAMHRALRQLALDRDSNINAIVVDLIAEELASAKQPGKAS